MVRSLVEFVAFCREQGLRIGKQQIMECIRVVQSGHLEEKIFKNCLRAICCKDKDQFDRFPLIFDMYWHQKAIIQKKERIKHRQKPKKNASTLIFLGKRESQPSQEEVKEMSGANTLENLKRTDFSAVRDIDEAVLNELALTLYQQMSRRLKRRKQKGKRGAIDLQLTMRNNISCGGDPSKLFFQEKKRERRKLVLLLDISGSMDKYSFYLLKFIYVLQSYFSSIEVFTFSTQLNRITKLLKKGNLDEVLKDISNELDSWSSGTKIAACLNHFVDIYAKQLLSKRCIVTILSDGLETGNVQNLAKSILKIKRRSKTIIWLNPLKGMPGYQPIQRGMASVLPHLDVFESAHNLNSLLKLEKYLQGI